MKKIILVFIVVLSLFVLLNSCSISGGVNANNGGVTQFNTGYVMAVQASPDAPQLSVFVNNSTWDSTLTFGKNTYYAQAPPGAYLFSAAKTYGSGREPLDTITLTVKPNGYYSYFLIDSFKNLQGVLTQDVFIRPYVDSVYVRFLNFSPNSSALSLVDSGRTSTYWASNRTFNDQAANAQNNLFGEHLKGNHTLYLIDTSNKVIHKQTVALTGGYVYTIYAAGFQGRTDSLGLSLKTYLNFQQR